MTTETTEQTAMRTDAAAQITIFWARAAEVRASAPPLATLYIDPAGMGGGISTTLMFDSKTPLADQVVIADRVLAGVQRWRDGIVEAVERQRTAEDELSAAREEIARLKAERNGEDVNA